MTEDYITERLESFVARGLYDQAVQLIRVIRNSEWRIELCRSALADDAIDRAIGEYGGVVVLEDEDKYKRAKIGMEDLSPHAVLYRDENGELHGIEDMIDFIPEDNPLKQLYRELESEE